MLLACSPRGTLGVLCPQAGAALSWVFKGVTRWSGLFSINSESRTLSHERGQGLGVRDRVGAAGSGENWMRGPRGVASERPNVNVSHKSEPCVI